MSFKVPSLPKLGKKGNPKEQFLKRCKGLPVSEFEALEIQGTIASGSFGIVKLCKKNEEHFVLKELMDEDADQKRLFIKEANLLHQLGHENVVKFHSVLLCGNNKYAFLMEYMHFNFSHFGNECKVSTLKDLLHSLDDYCNFSGFEHLGLCIAKDICSGLAFLHKNDVVHRDLKPDNVLVSNQHYSKDTIGKFWKTKPVIAKLTDFGESRSKLIQTSTLLHSKTVNINRGTPVFMAPEIFRKTSSHMTLHQLKLTDVWSMAMIFFLLINPDQRYPYQEEIRDLKTSGKSPADIMSSLFTNLKLPGYSKKYNELRVEHWTVIEKVFLFSAKFDNRPTVNEVQTLLIGKSFEKKDRNIFSDFRITSRSSTVIDSDNVYVETFNTNMVPKEPEMPPEESNKEGHISCSEMIMSSSQRKRKLPSCVQLEENSKEGHIFGSELLLSAPQKKQKQHSCPKSAANDNSPIENSLPSINNCKERDTEESKCEEETTDSGKTILCSYVCDREDMQMNLFSNSQVCKEKSSAENILPGEIPKKKRVKAFDAVMGHHHQSSPEIFKHAAAGTQCSTISLTALVAASLKSVENWNSSDIDEILHQGDSLHLNILERYEWPLKRNESKLDIDEMPNTISLEFSGYETDVSIGLLSDASFGFSSDLHSLILDALNSKPNKSFILRTFGSCVAIICGQYQEYFIFDPHSRNAEGEIDANGSAGLFHFRNSSDMISYLQDQCGTRNEQVDLFPTDVEIIRIQECARRNPFDLNLSNDRVSQVPQPENSVMYALKEKGLQLKDIIEICACKVTVESSKICKSVPSPQKNAVFVVDTEVVKERDLTCDDSGIYDSPL